MSEAPESGVYYQCQRCGNCCRWLGFVKVGDAEIGQLAAPIGVFEDEFIQQYTRLPPAGTG